jgi:hypothetical protein
MNQILMQKWFLLQNIKDLSYFRNGVFNNKELTYSRRGIQRCCLFGRVSAKIHPCRRTAKISAPSLIYLNQRWPTFLFSSATLFD